MSRKTIKTTKAPGAIGPYSQAVQAGNLLFISGQIALDPQTGNLVQDDVVTQTRQVMQNLKNIAEAGGASLQSAVKCTIYLADMSDFQVVNEVYGSFFDDSPPARVTVEVSRLPKDVAVEIDAIIWLD